VKQSLSKGKRLIIVHTGGEEGFVPNVLLIWEAQSFSDNYHDNMNKDNYYNWVTAKLLPNLSKNSVTVLNNSSYHCHQSNRAPNSNSFKKNMINWLTKNNISFDSKQNHNGSIKKIAELCNKK
jgi:hypothetical protein